MSWSNDDSLDAPDLECFGLCLNILGLFLALSIYFYLFSKFGDDEALAVLCELKLYFLHAKRGKVTIKRVTDLETLYFTLEMLLNLLDLL